MCFLCKVMLPKEEEIEKVEMCKETGVHISKRDAQITQMTNKWHEFVAVLPSYPKSVQLWVTGTDGDGVTLNRGSLTSVGQEW